MNSGLVGHKWLQSDVTFSESVLLKDFSVEIRVCKQMH